MSIIFPNIYLIIFCFVSFIIGYCFALYARQPSHESKELINEESKDLESKKTKNINTIDLKNDIPPEEVLQSPSEEEKRLDLEDIIVGQIRAVKKVGRGGIKIKDNNINQKK